VAEVSLWETVLVTEEVIQEIVELGMKVSPREACGLLCPDGTVLELPNHAEGEMEYSALGVDMVEALTQWAADKDIPQDTHFDAIVWHTHPSGSVGPSADDLANRAEDMRYLVVSLPNGEAVQF
jgi:proteasome lid subunit RPN8/RPN11